MDFSKFPGTKTNLWQISQPSEALEDTVLMDSSYAIGGYPWPFPFKKSQQWKAVFENPSGDIPLNPRLRSLLRWLSFENNPKQFYLFLFFIRDTYALKNKEIYAPKTDHRKDQPLSLAWGVRGYRKNPVVFFSVGFCFLCHGTRVLQFAKRPNSCNGRSGNILLLIRTTCTVFLFQGSVECFTSWVEIHKYIDPWRFIMDSFHLYTVYCHICWNRTKLYIYNT